MFRFSTVSLLTLASLLGTCLLGGAKLEAQTFSPPIPSWTQAPGAAARFTYATSGYDRVNSYLCAALSAIAYPAGVGMDPFSDSEADRTEYNRRIKHILGNGTAGWGFRRVTPIYIASTDSEAIVLETADYVLVVARGTENSDPGSSIKDWHTNTAVKPVAWGGGFVHVGYKNVGTSATNEVFKAIRKTDLSLLLSSSWTVRRRTAPKPDTRPIFTTDHSLGGALAIVLAYDLKTSKNMPVRAVYTIGQPMLGNQWFANSFASHGLKLHRVVNCADIVPRFLGELRYMPQDFDFVRAMVLSHILNRFPSSVAPTVRMLANLTLSLNVFLNNFVDSALIANPNGAGYVHFGSLHYYNRNRVVMVNPSLYARRLDMRKVYAKGYTNIFDSFDPGSIFDYPSPSAYFARIWAIKTKVMKVVANPVKFLARLATVRTRAVSDHQPNQYLQRLWSSLSSSQRAGLPSRPPSR